MSLLDDWSLSLHLEDSSLDESESDDNENEYYPEDWREEETLEVVNEVIYQVPSLQDLSQRVVVTDLNVAKCSVPCIPTSVHTDLFTAAARLIPLYGDDLIPVISHLVSTWPKQSFSLKDVLPSNGVSSVFNSGHQEGGHNTLLDGITMGLLRITPEANLRVADFTGFNIPGLFALPLLFLPKEQRLSNTIMERIQDSCTQRVEGISDDDGLENVLSWKLSTIAAAQTTPNFQGRGNIEIITDASLDLGDWMSIVEEIIGLTLQHLTPFRLKVRKLGIYNLEAKQYSVFSWMLSMLDLTAIDKLVLYGARKAITPLLYHIRADFTRLSNITKLDMGIAYPTIRCYHSTADPDEILRAEIDVFRHWNHITEIYFIGINMTCKLRHWFGAMRQRLQVVNLHACYLSAEDMSYLAGSHHTETLVELGLDKNSLSGAADALSDVLRNSKALNTFSVVDTQLDAEEKAKLVAALQGATRLHTLSMYEQENSLAMESYMKLVELACAIAPLRGFYLFPFNYKPFDKVYKSAVTEACDKILRVNHRSGMELGF